MESTEPKIIPISDNENYQSNFKNTGAFEHSSPTTFNKRGNSGGGGGNMEDEYATKAYVDRKMDKVSDKIGLLEAHLDTKFEKVNTKFANQRTWIIVTLLTVVGSGTGFFQFLIGILQKLKF
ncbi:hypothetical protein HCC74_08260 [Lentilactobacillus parabuchneri]|jgi:hypothetical protein|nr:hypothetical protein [Lentilactobacillus parabuchneri]MBW0221608.1 hypothetical protein [Lentilactobacillus parabuchneri]MBW0245167.1 hypothetical protein [Lentilactobacillus parabuchneri]MBW0263246.1 hypothetical protein [Lentilactobacillus parabuchneri]MCT2885594.1 hypothetical protein [Lentilactobacillus parabuchneri]MDG9736711.1 hypothetical protein [Lentilactobacillus parabuchneri]